VLECILGVLRVIGPGLLSKVGAGGVAFRDGSPFALKIIPPQSAQYEAFARANILCPANPAKGPALLNGSNLNRLEGILLDLRLIGSRSTGSHNVDLASGVQRWQKV